MKHLIIIILLFAMLPAAGQITAPGASAVRTTEYPGGYTPNDPVYIFCSTGTTTASLNASSPGGTAPFTFEWYRWSVGDNGFTIHVKTDAGVGSSSATGLAEGGYRVRITDGGGYDEALIAWVHLAQPTAEASLGGQGNCYYVPLVGQAKADEFFYHHPVTGEDIKLLYGISNYTWFFNESIETSGYLSYFSYNLPYEDGTYKLTVTDNFGCVAESSFFYQSIHAKADFTVEPSIGEAPLEVVLTDNSIRAFSYKWEFGDDSISTNKGSLSHIYYKPGTYIITLTIESEQFCIDLMMYQYVTVKPSALSIPNVFTPDGDGLNEFFKPDITSLRFIDMQIFSRSGLMVYSFRGEGEKLKEWQGWDGTVNNSRAKASPGIYFYVIRAAGWDNIIYGTKQHRGFLYLYR